MICGWHGTEWYIDVMLAFSHVPILSRIVAVCFSCVVVLSYGCRRLDILPSSCVPLCCRRVVVDVLRLRRHVAVVVLLRCRRATGVIVISIRRGFCPLTSACP